MADRIHVWAWLAGALDPVPVGRLDETGGETSFAYDASYLDRVDAIPLYAPELPLRRGRQRPSVGLSVPGCIADAWPDGWSRVVIERRLRDRDVDVSNLHAFEYLRASGSDRFGALDFIDDDTSWKPRGGRSATLDDLQHVSGLIEAGESIDPSLGAAMDQATASGGMRPKATIKVRGISCIAKLSSRSDTRPVTNIEAFAMDLATHAGLHVAPTRLVRAAGRDVLLVERFDRDSSGRVMVVSAATMLGIDPFLGARYATYHELADQLRALSRVAGDARELFARIVFNILVGNTDDHARNHAALWDGKHLQLSPAFDICPQQRTGGETGQAMEIGRDGFRAANLAGCVDHSGEYALDRNEAVDIVNRQVEAIHAEWDEAADRARLTSADRRTLKGGSLLNDSVFYGWERIAPGIARSPQRQEHKARPN